MADYQFVVDQIRGFLAGADQTRNDSLVELSASYAELCQEANVRLRRCVDYLRRGLRSEAIHSAEQPPNLLDVVAALDIPEIELWEELCAAYQLTRPGRLMIEAAQELNEAYALEKPLQSLLSAHRVLALRPAPLAERLEVIRKLAAEDPDNPAWTDDQQTFETARLIELRPSVAAAIKSKDVKIIDGLSAEITAQKWRAEIPPDIREGLSKASWSIHAEAAIKQLRQSAPAIEQRLQDGIFPDARQVLASWDRIVSANKMELPADLRPTWERLRQWVANEKALSQQHAAMEAACADLRAVLNLNATEESVQTCYRAVQAVGLPIPIALERDYRARKKNLERSRKFEQYGLYGLIGLASLAAVVGVILMIWSHFRTGTH